MAKCNKLKRSEADANFGKCTGGPLGAGGWVKKQQLAAIIPSSELKVAMSTCSAMLHRQPKGEAIIDIPNNVYASGLGELRLL